MKIFIAGATGVIGRRMVKLCREARLEVVGTTRTPAKGRALSVLGATPIVVDVFDRDALMGAVEVTQPDVIVHQLTDLTSPPGSPGYAESLARNSKLRIEGTRNLVAAAQAAGVKRMIAQSIAFMYAPGKAPYVEDDPLDPKATGVIALEAATMQTQGLEGVVLRYGMLYGSGTWYATPPKSPALHVDAAAHAALLAMKKAPAGIYNIADDDGGVSSEKAKRAFGFDASFRMDP